MTDFVELDSLESLFLRNVTLQLLICYSQQKLDRELCE